MRMTQQELDALLRRNKGVTVEGNKAAPMIMTMEHFKPFDCIKPFTTYPKPLISNPEAKEGQSGRVVLNQPPEEGESYCGPFSLYLEGIPPSKKNSKQIISIPCKGGKRRPMLISSKQYLEWEKRAMCSFRNQYKGDIIAYPISIHFTFFYKDKRIWDLSNKIEGILDALRGIVIKDDHRFIVSKLIIEQALSGPPSVKMTIERLKE